uniref:C2H2-type domain-containing protein n=1 Tax=Chromera velia CCMP2878 TaxID=1169474 RepID=A0A0G4IDM3_9ALVE|eukprot:Cvel_13421.t1-p1 / transcript=Cvel_13421.t1 / gene=Cvel_13421 / organism=Chromera_velia_CCMP2878 / gene_product=hypothetical protein / transcript_product=hypothetical protein / location=Cvel_scaffold915:47781-49975(+) / protein_length=131 / sequence_SO=supercontig / SO=protein_coding / is_pseudo=false
MNYSGDVGRKEGERRLVRVPEKVQKTTERQVILEDRSDMKKVGQRWEDYFVCAGNSATSERLCDWCALLATTRCSFKDCRTYVCSLKCYKAHNKEVHTPESQAAAAAYLMSDSIGYDRPVGRRDGDVQMDG